MKIRTICAILCAALFAALLVPCAGAVNEDWYNGALDGTTLYTVNFNGDAYYTPAKTKGDMKVEVDPLDSNKVTLSANTDKAQNWWGGTVSSLPLNDDTLYTVHYSVTRAGNAAVGYYPDANYGVYGYPEKIRLMNVAASLSGHEYKSFASEGVGFQPAGDIMPQEYAVEVNGYNKTLAAYLKDSMTGEYKLIDKSLQDEIPIFYTEQLGIYFYVYYANQVSTISNCYVVRGLEFGEIEPIETEPETTKAPVTEAPKTEAPVLTGVPQTEAAASATEAPAADTPATQAPAATEAPAAQKSGCGSAVGMGAALIACLGCALIRKKK